MHSSNGVLVKRVQHLASRITEKLSMLKSSEGQRKGVVARLVRQAIGKVCQATETVCQAIGKVCQAIGRVCQAIGKVCQATGKASKMTRWVRPGGVGLSTACESARATSTSVPEFYSEVVRVAPAVPTGEEGAWPS